MKNEFLKYTKSLLTACSISAILFSCTKKDVVIDFKYPAATVGIAQAAVATVGPGGNGIYTITPKVYNQSYRYLADVTAGKFNVPLGVLRSGVDAGGSIEVNVSAATDTVSKMITAGKLVAGTELLPTTAYTLPASVTLDDGALSGGFNLAVDLNFLITNVAKKYAVAVVISSSKSDVVNAKLSTVVVYINVSGALLPIANFSNSIDNFFKKADFVNLSSNGTTYSWNYGDGSPVENTPSPSHKYAAAGSYTVTLTTTGVTGAPSLKTTTVVIP